MIGRVHFAASALVLWVLAACSDGDSPDAAVNADLAADAGPRQDSGFADLGPTDTGSANGDAGVADTGAPDAQEPLGPVQVDPNSQDAPPLLSDFRFFRLENGLPVYNDGVVAYDLNTPLFSDFTIKWRAVYVPPGEKIMFDASESFEFPVGSAIIKSFAMAPDLRAPQAGVRIIETRVLVRTTSGWNAYPYLWREDLSDADYHLRGAVFPLPFIDPRGQSRVAQYLVPQRNQCSACHAQNDPEGNAFMTILGPKARYLHRSFVYPEGERNQLTHLADLGLLDGLPPLDEIDAAFDFAPFVETGTTSLDGLAIEGAARDYLDINCAHCHNPDSTQGVTSQLFLHRSNTDLFRLGVCKEPGSAGSGSGGLRFDIVPGDPDASILQFRIESETAGEMMPLIGRSLRDDPGVELIRAWIAGMKATPCE